MQLLVRTLAGRTVVVQADAEERVGALKARAVGGPPELVRLLRAGHELDDAQTLGELQLGNDAILQTALRLRGGVLTSVKLVTQRYSEQSVTVRRAARRGACPLARTAHGLTRADCAAQIDVDEGDRPSVVKQRLEKAIGVPAADMKLRLSGHNQMVMVDTASNIKVGSCGVTQGAQRHARALWLRVRC